MILLEVSSNTAPILLAVATLVGTLFTGFLGYLSVKKVQENTNKTEAIAVDTAKIAVKTGEIEIQGNSRAAAMQKKLDDYLREIDELKKMVAQLTPGAREAGVRAADEKASKEEPDNPPQPA